MKKYLKNQRGVTLIELLGVIVILGILAVIAVPAVMNQIDEAEVAANDTNLVIISDALERALIMEDIDSADFPMTLTPTAITGPSASDLTGDLIPDYLKEIPKDKSYTATIDADKIITVKPTTEE